MSINKAAAWLISTALILTLIVVGKTFLIPLFIALFIWYLVNAINTLFQKLPRFYRPLPQWLTLSMSLVFIMLMLYTIGDLIAQNISGMITAAPNYRLNLEQQAGRIFALFGREYPGFSSLAKEIDLQNFITTVLNGVTGIAKNFFLVLLYVLFLLFEQGVFPRKLKALRLTEEQRSRLLFTLSHINTAMRKYLGVKTFTSLLTAILSFVILEGVQLDFALFWAFIIFLFNYIPTIGSITALPALLSLVQFDGLTPFFVIIFAVTGVQILIGNVLEPRLMGDSLNISPFVVILSLILWSILWGVVGMLLCVPITVAIIIICAQFPTTRPVAVLLSRNGQVLDTFKLTPRRPQPEPEPRPIA